MSPNGPSEERATSQRNEGTNMGYESLDLVPRSRLTVPGMRCMPASAFPERIFHAARTDMRCLGLCLWAHVNGASAGGRQGRSNSEHLRCACG